MQYYWEGFGANLLTPEERLSVVDCRMNPFLAFSFLLCTLIAGSYVILTLGNVLNISLVCYALPMALLPCVGLTYGYYFAFSRRNIVIGIMLAVILAILGIGLSHILDFNMDGIAYHQPGAEAIINGWNPLNAENSASLLFQQVLFPSGAWALEACLAMLYGSIEASKALCLWWLFITVPVMCEGLRNALGKLWISHYIMAVLLVCNPIVVKQIVTNYIDGLLYLEGMTFIGAVLMQGESICRNRLSCFFMAISLLFIINTKLSGLYYGVMLCTGAVIYMYLQKKRIPWQMACFLFAVGIVSTIVFGHRPYVTSLLQYGSFFPWDPAGLVVGLMPSNFTSLPEFLRFFYSIFSVMGKSGGEPAVLKWPWVVYKKELLNEALAPLTGGFGPLFALGLLLAVILFLYHLLYHRKEQDISVIHKGLVGIAIILLIFSMFFLGSWWARYVPFAYAIPFLLLLAVRNYTRWSYMVLCLVLCVFAVNVYFMGMGTYRNQYRIQAEFYRTTTILHKVARHTVYLVPVWAGENYQTTTRAYSVIQRRLREQNIDSIVKVNAACDHRAASWAEFDVCY